MAAYVVIQSTSMPAVRRRQDFQRLLTRHGATLLAGSETPADDGTSMTIAVPDMARARRLAAALRKLTDIDAAYAKPAAELPM